MMTKIRKRIQAERGFTLIEMTLVLFIISALLLLFIPNLTGRQETASETGSDAIETVLQSQVELYKMDKGKAPTSFNDMQTEKYLTPQQAKRAADEFNLSGGQVIRK